MDSISQANLKLQAKTRVTRRQCFAVLAPIVALTRSEVGAAPSGKPMRGAFMILSTPYSVSGEVDWADLVREAVFVDRCGAQGIVWPQGSSGVAFLTRKERMRGMELLAETMRDKNAVLVLGVQGRNTAEMLEYARRAEELAPDALIAMPPSLATSQDDYREYFRALAELTQRPVILQSSGGARDLAPSVDLLVELAGEFPHLAYVKEESNPLLERMLAEIRKRPPIRSVFGANFAQGWLYEMRLGLDGVITGNAMYADLMAMIWKLHEQGKHDELRDAYSRFLLMHNLNQEVPGADLYIMKKRGLFKTTITRREGGLKQLEFAPEAIAEIEFRYAALRPYLIAG
jgi:4-hydroxy-tetrahydrodipicolinate synthase